VCVVGLGEGEPLLARLFEEIPRVVPGGERVSKTAFKPSVRRAEGPGSNERTFCSTLCNKGTAHDVEKPSVLLSQISTPLCFLILKAASKTTMCAVSTSTSSSFSSAIAS
jgi:hypothetical protein